MISQMAYDIGEKYDKIAQWWHNCHKASNYGLSQLERAISYCRSRRSALDVGCGDDYGDHESDWHSDKFYYSPIGINENLKVIMESSCECRHLERDQYPEKQVFIIAQKK